jgi:hypothetical protein
MPVWYKKNVKLLLVVTAVCLSAGCSKGESLDCEAVVGHYMSKVEALIERQSESPETRKLATTGLPGLREKLVAACREQEWSEAARKCILRAETAEQLETCNPISDAE